MQPNGARKKRLAHAIFSNDGPYLNKPDVTNRPRVTPNRYRASKRKVAHDGQSISGMGDGHCGGDQSFGKPSQRHAEGPAA